MFQSEEYGELFSFKGRCSIIYIFFHSSRHGTEKTRPSRVFLYPSTTELSYHDSTSSPASGRVERAVNIDNLHFVVFSLEIRYVFKSTGFGNELRVRILYNFFGFLVR